MPARTAEPVAKLLICIESFVADYPGEQFKQFIGRKGVTIIEVGSTEAKLWGKFFEAVKPNYPYPRVEPIMAAPGDL